MPNPGIGATSTNQTDAYGNLSSPNFVSIINGNANGQASAANSSPVISAIEQGNQDNIVLFASASRTTTQTTPDQINLFARGIILILDVTVPGTGSVTLTINMKDPVSGKYKLILAGAAVITQVTNIYTIYPGAVVTANVSANANLPKTWQAIVTANNANPVTYSLGASTLI